MAELAQGGVGDGDAFGLAGGAGGVDDVGEIVGDREDAFAGKPRSYRGCGVFES